MIFSLLTNLSVLHPSKIIISPYRLLCDVNIRSISAHSQLLRYHLSLAVSEILVRVSVLLICTIIHADSKWQVSVLRLGDIFAIKLNPKGGFRLLRLAFLDRREQKVP
jgi:hypothetical protein